MAAQVARDLFSKQAALYAQYRPRYPQSLLDFVVSHCKGRRDLAWDVGTGNGQAAVEIAKSFTRVVATDISEAQISHAPPRHNIQYQVTPHQLSDEELHSALGPAASVDLITVAQAYHWFDFRYFAEAARKVLRPGGVVAVWGYGIGRVSPEFDSVMDEWYRSTDPYWEPEREYVDEMYRTIPFYFDPLPGTAEGTGPFFFTSELQLSLTDVYGYLSSWSAVQTALKQGVVLLDEGAMARFKAAWGQSDPNCPRSVNVPMFVRLGTVPQSGTEL